MRTSLVNGLGISGGAGGRLERGLPPGAAGGGGDRDARRTPARPPARRSPVPPLRLRPGWTGWNSAKGPERAGADFFNVRPEPWKVHLVGLC